MKVLGAVLAGGRSTRFGSDKAEALYRGKALLDHANLALSAHCEVVVVAGREDGVPDWPRPDCGPLGGIGGALHHAAEHGFDAVLTCGVDSLRLPADLLDLLLPGPAYVAAQPVVGLWPVTSLGALEGLLLSDRKHSMRAFAELIGARPVDLEQAPANINTPADLAALEHDHGL
jgi:molybdopterin-guanine dinucleotide biosynthesis protein A